MAVGPVLALGVLAAPAGAQVLSPNITFNGPRNSSIHATPAEALLNIEYERARTSQYSSPVTGAYYPKDSMRAVAETRASSWVKALEASPVKGLQIDPYGVISVSAHQEDVAKRQITERLATPGLSFTDKAYTLQMAAGAFASSDYPERLPIAEGYVKQLDAMGTKAAYWQFSARRPLIYAYYRLGRSADVARTGLAAFALVNVMPYERREDMFSPGIWMDYAAVVDALSGQPGGRATIKAMNKKLMEATVAPAPLVAADSFFAWNSEWWRNHMQGEIDLAERVGEAATPMVSNYWVNRGPSRDSQSVAVNDGKIRIIEIGSFTCGPCVAAIPGLERLHKQFPDIEVTFLTAGLGRWGNRIVPGKVEAEHLADHFVNNLHATFPIGIAMPVWVPAEDGGETTMVPTPTWHAGKYPQAGKPTFYVLDGKGMVRRVIGGYNRDLEENLAAIVQYLQKEAKNGASQAHNSVPATTVATR